MVAFLKLIRVPNLLIIAFTQYVVRYFLIYPMLNANGLNLFVNDFIFFLLVLSTMMVAAAGYVINDYFDINIDKINKPERLVIGKFIKRRIAIGAHTLMNFIAIVIGLFISIAIGYWQLIFIHLFWTLGLWFYSTNFKRQFFIGNFIIAIFVALVPFVVGIYDLLPIYKQVIGTENQELLGKIWMLVIYVSFFAFISTLLREIIKDIEDYDGDKEFGCKTMPIVIGKANTKIIVVILSAFTMLCLLYIQQIQYSYNDWYSLLYFSVLLQLPFILLIYQTIKAKTKQQLHLAGLFAKLIMVSGVSYLFLYSYIYY